MKKILAFAVSVSLLALAGSAMAQTCPQMAGAKKECTKCDMKAAKGKTAHSAKSAHNCASGKCGMMAKSGKTAKKVAVKPAPAKKAK